MFIARGEDDGAGVVADEALGDESGTNVVRRRGSSLLQHSVGGQHLCNQSVTVGSRFQLIHFGENRFSLGRFLTLLLLSRY